MFLIVLNTDNMQNPCKVNWLSCLSTIGYMFILFLCGKGSQSWLERGRDFFLDSKCPPPPGHKTVCSRKYQNMELSVAVTLMASEIGTGEPHHEKRPLPPGAGQSADCYLLTEWLGPVDLWVNREFPIRLHRCVGCNAPVPAPPPPPPTPTPMSVYDKMTLLSCSVLKLGAGRSVIYLKAIQLLIINMRVISFILYILDTVDKRDVFSTVLFWVNLYKYYHKGIRDII